MTDVTGMAMAPSLSGEFGWQAAADLGTNYLAAFRRG
jgi:hypothetical protein